ncbi:MAG TPA: hypothetical protein VFQ03_00260, partial [Candidatus Binatia bacterium]|nr:hypothetical protein [Candidatus Binatia bacterium]
IDVALEGADTVYIANTASRFIFHLYGDPAVKTVADLKGKVLAATQPAACCYANTDWFLTRT